MEFRFSKIFYRLVTFFFFSPISTGRVGYKSISNPREFVQAVARYTEAYCDQFELRSRVRLHHEVTHVWPADLGQRLSPWHLRAANTETGEVVEATYHQVVVAAGKEWQPRYPAQVKKTRQNFSGVQLHSKEYARDETYGATFGGRTVLVVGASASGLDIVQEVATVATRVYIR